MTTSRDRSSTGSNGVFKLVGDKKVVENTKFQYLKCAQRKSCRLGADWSQRYHLISSGHRSMMQDIAGKMDVPTLDVTN
jgi:hypothetical protein